MSDLNNPEFVKTHKVMVDSLNNIGETWTQEVHVMAPVNKVYQDVNVFTYYQNNTYNESTKEFEYLQAWPRLMPDGELAWAMQKAANTIQGPSYRFEQPGPPKRQPQTYGLRFDGPVLVDSVTTQVDSTGGVPPYFQSSTSDSSTVYEVYDSATGQSIYNEVVTIFKAKKRRYYSASLQLFVDPDRTNNVMLWIYFDSRGEVPPQVINDAMNAYRNGSIPLREDPNSPGSMIPLYIPSIDGNSSTVYTAENPESPDSKNKGFKGHCIAKNGQVVTPNIGGSS